MTQKSSQRWIRFWPIPCLALAGIGLAATWPQWQPWVEQLVRPGQTAARNSGSGEAEHDQDHAGHDHAHDDANSLELSLQARRNLGLNAETVRPIQLSTFRRTITVPAVITERTGRTLIHVATPLTGVVQHVHAVTGEAVVANTVLFDIRLTHEDLVQTQSEFLQQLGERDVETREIKRLESIADSGAIAGKTLLERHYALDRLTAQLKAKREALRLHGLSDRQILEIEETRHLLSELKITAPSPDEHPDREELQLTGDGTSPVLFEESASSRTPLMIEKLTAHKGQSVLAGELLCVLADYHRLFLEGKAFEQDATAINRAVENNWTLTAILDDGQMRREVPDLHVSYVANNVDVNSRTLSFFVDLPNEIIRDETNREGQRFITWKYRIGQRMQLLVPVEEWPDEMVVPVDAVAREAAESFVFQKNGSHFDRVSVHVKYRDQQHVVIANDGAIQPGAMIAMRSAHQMQMALKNKSGGGVDPHAGHNH